MSSGVPSDLPVQRPCPGSTVRLTVVVPTRNSGRTLEACLRSIRAQTVPVELLVVDNHSTDETLAIAHAYADEVLIAGPERSAQRNAGLRAAAGEVVCFIDSDMLIEAPLAEQALAAFSADPHVGAVVLPEFAFGQGYFAQCRALEKRLYLGDATVEAARAFRRVALSEVGGYDEDMTGAEDWELPDRVERAGWRLLRVKARVWHDEGRVRIRHQFRKKRYYGGGVRRYTATVPTEHRRPISRRSLLNPVALLHDPVHAPGLLALKVVEAAGVAAGSLQQARHERRRS